MLFSVESEHIDPLYGFDTPRTLTVGKRGDRCRAESVSIRELA